MADGVKSTEIAGGSVRQNLVDTAVNFLLNLDVKNKPDHTKVGFLKNKGLTDAEISEAFAKVKADPRYVSIPVQSDPQPFVYPQRNYSFWSQLSRFSSSFIVLAVTLYGLHRFYKLYIEPWLFGIKSEAEEQNDLKKIVLELNDSVSELRNTVSSLVLVVSAQKEQTDQIFLQEGSPYMPIPLAVAELKTEIGAVKSLLINRHQFPAVPKVSTPSIPLWQLPASNGGNADDSPEAKPLEEQTENCIGLKSSETESDIPKNLPTKSDSEHSSIESYFEPTAYLGKAESIQNGITLDNNSTDC